MAATQKRSTPHPTAMGWFLPMKFASDNQTPVADNGNGPVRRSKVLLEPKRAGF